MHACNGKIREGFLEEVTNGQCRFRVERDEGR